MASSDVDQRFLALAAKRTNSEDPLAAAAFHTILGNSVLLARKLYRARKLRKLDTSRDTKSLALYQHIIWMSREGLEILDTYILPRVMEGRFHEEDRVLSIKLRASYHHIFCLFHNQPPVSQTGNPYYKPSSGSPKSSPRAGNGKRNASGARNSGSPTSKSHGGLREPIDSITSETSFVTNPYTSSSAVNRLPPPGFAPNAPPGLSPVRVPQPSAFLLPPMNWLPLTSSYFVSASAYAQQCLSGSHPLRLSVALEHSAFLWDCLHDHDGARTMARVAIRDVYRAPDSMADEEFQAAAEMVNVLGRMMKRKSWEGTPRPGPNSVSPPQIAVPTSNGAPVPPVPSIAAQQSPRTPQQRPTRPTPSGSGGSQGEYRTRGSGSKEHTPQHVTFDASLPYEIDTIDRSNPPRAYRSSAATRGSRTKDSPTSPQHNRRSSGGSRKGGGSNETTPRAGAVSGGVGGNRASYSSAGSITPRAVQPIDPRSAGRRQGDSPGRGALGRGGGQVMGR